MPGKLKAFNGHVVSFSRYQYVGYISSVNIDTFEQYSYPDEYYTPNFLSRTDDELFWVEDNFGDGVTIVPQMMKRDFLNLRTETSAAPNK